MNDALHFTRQPYYRLYFVSRNNKDINNKLIINILIKNINILIK